MTPPGAHPVLVPGYLVKCGKCGAKYVVMAGDPVKDGLPVWQKRPRSCRECHQTGYWAGPRGRGRPKKIV
jgi:hypothetical protein